MQKTKVNLEDLLRIVEICKVVSNRGVDPFEVDIKTALEKLKKYLPQWKVLDDLLIDAEALNQLSSIIKLQSDWIKNRSSSLYVDPVFIELKVRMLDPKSLVEAFIGAWHPIVENNQIFPQRMEEAVDYWNNLKPLNERWREDFSSGSSTSSFEIEDLIQLKILSIENFDKKMEQVSEELKQKLKMENKIDYWNFICQDNFEKTLERAYITSFILTESHATLMIDSLEERIFIVAINEPKQVAEKKRHFSIPIAFDAESCKKLKVEHS